MLSPDLVKLDLASGSEQEAILEVAGLLSGFPEVVDFQRFCSEVIEREKVTSTASDRQVAFPHARTDAVRNIVCAVGYSRDGIPFQNGNLVHFLFVIGTPKAMVREYLDTIGKLARGLKNSGYREKLAGAKSREEFTEILNQLF